jgi:hypothetical protein
MRVRQFELRLIGLGLVLAWTAAAALILLAYRPGGPLDVVVGLAMLSPIAIAFAGVLWPPVTRGAGAFPLMIALGLGALLVLLPSIGGVLDQLLALGSQTLLPSLEAAYPWLLALAGTSLFSAFGIARRLQGGGALRRRRLVAGVGIAAALTLIVGLLCASVVIANEVALSGTPAQPGTSRYGPTDAAGEPPACDAPIEVGPTARVEMHLDGTIDLRPIGSVELIGIRAGRDFRWSSYVATDRQLGSYGAAHIGDTTWARTPSSGWERTISPEIAGQTVDMQALETALSPGYRVTAEDRGIEVIDGARARRCRVAVDGATFQAAFPEVAWLVGDADLVHWRGQLDYWVFLDGQLGQLAGSANGEAVGLAADALQATLEVRMSATERGRDHVVYPPPR